MDEREFRHIVNENAAPLTAYAFAICSDIHTAQDAVQETFMQYLKSCGGVQNIRPWLYRVCRNKLIDGFKASGARPAAPLENLNVPSEERNASENLQREEVHEALFAAIARLKEGEAEILNLKYFGEMSYEEIAEVLGISVSNVGVRLVRALESLKKIMKTEEISKAEGCL